ncbi:hypothetical protein NBRC110019_16210 [Neptunitalea chrysea]|uniref:Uncharacterized protein n=1 Tax=Neptunitalea chrysea TaxID=1647581 RepID=A0A9W6EV74_9FLAO|nr:hypothetical protein [Neptunitalea chrysea]GLB52581.1 hypothetical protein NBRC110019_16210 [Neptunitalea chrysea]
MRTILPILTCLIICYNAIAQTPQEIIQNLLDVALITQEQRVDYQDDLDALNHAPTTADYLSLLYRLEYHGNPGVAYYEYFDDLKKENQHKIHTKYSTTKSIRDVLTTKLKKLENIGLISSYLSTKTLAFAEKLDKRSGFAEAYAFSYLIAIIERQEVLYNPDYHLRAFADSLKTNGLITSQYNELVESIENKTLIGTRDLLKYCDNTLTIEKASDNESLEDYMISIHEKVIRMLSEKIQFYNFYSYKTKADRAPSNHKNCHLITAISAYEKEYEYRSSTLFCGTDETKDKLNYILEENWQYLFNKVFVEEQLPYRIFPITTLKDNRGGVAYMLVPLDAVSFLSQKNNLIHINTERDVSYKSNGISKEALGVRFNQCNAIGLFDHLSKSEMEKAASLSNQQYITSYWKWIHNYPYVLEEVSTTIPDGLTPYKELLKVFSELSHGDLKPKNIVDNYYETEVPNTISFTANGTKFSKTIATNAQFKLDLDFIHFMNEVAVALNLPRRFYGYVDNEKEIITMLYLTNEQFDFFNNTNFSL